MHDRWLIGCVVLVLSACGGVVTSSHNDGAGATTTGGSASSMGGSASTTGGGVSVQGGQSSSSGSPASAGTTSMGGASPMPVQCGKAVCPGGFCCNAACGICGAPDGACPDIACMQPPQDACAALSTAPVVLGCAQEMGVAVDPNAAVSVSVPDGAVTEQRPRARMGGCLEPLLNLQPNGPALSAQALSWIVTVGNRSWDVEAVVEGNRFPSLLGERVSVSYSYEFGGFGPTRRELSVATKLSPSRGVWIAEGGDLPQLGKLPLLLSRGQIACSATEQCGSYNRYDIAATDPLSMKTIAVPHGQSSSFGQWVIVHGGYAEQTSAGTSCADWFVADVRVAILGL